jgi:hypothetical protein
MLLGYPSAPTNGASDPLCCTAFCLHGSNGQSYAVAPRPFRYVINGSFRLIWCSTNPSLFIIRFISLHPLSQDDAEAGRTSTVDIILLRNVDLFSCDNADVSVLKFQSLSNFLGFIPYVENVFYNHLKWMNWNEALKVGSENNYFLAIKTS